MKVTLKNFTIQEIRDLCTGDCSKCPIQKSLDEFFNTPPDCCALSIGELMDYFDNDTDLVVDFDFRNFRKGQIE